MEQKTLDEIKAREQAATPGPWNHIEHKNGRYYVGTDKKPIADICNLYHTESEANLAFISHARTDIPVLIAEVERLTAENKEIRAQLDRFVEADFKVGAENATLKRALELACKCLASIVPIYQGGAQIYGARDKQEFIDLYMEQARQRTDEVTHGEAEK